MSYPPSFYGYAPQIDPDIHDFVITEHPHTKLHESKAFVASAVATVTAANTFVMQFLTGAGVEAHMVFSTALSGNSVMLEFFEAPTTSGGTPVSAICRHRQSVKTAVTSCSSGVTISNVGTLLYALHLPADKAFASSDRSISEFVLAPSTKYLLRYTVDAGSTAVISCAADWYEVTE